MDTTVERNGKITRYGFACGYAESYDATGRIRDYYLTDANAVRLSYNGASYDVHTRVQGVTDWEQFDNLTDARKAVAKARRSL